MSIAAEKVAEVLALPQEDRAFLARRLIASLDDTVDTDAETQWREVIDRRSREIQEGNVSCRPVEQVLQDVRHKLHARRQPSGSRGGTGGCGAVAMRNSSRAWGDDFLDEFERTLRRIVAEPGRWHQIQGDNRKLNFHQFPYAIAYRLHADDLYVTAVMHLHRRPFCRAHRQPV